MNIGGKPWRTIWENPETGNVDVLDQRVLPHRVEVRALSDLATAAEAIRDMTVRGAPLIGATAGYGMWLAVRSVDEDRVDAAAAEARRVLDATRPTAVNLHWATRTVQARIAGAKDGNKRAAALECAREIVAQELDRSRRIGEHGLALIRDIAARKGGGPVQVLTHCNAGWLAAVDHGTATAPIYAAQAAGIALHVWVDETRPRNQGASLTAFELSEQGVPHSVIVDNAGGHLMRHGMVDLCIVGADRVAANGDAANKIGTYLKALAAHDNGVPFTVALPSSTIDFDLPTGDGIPIEERDPDEVRCIQGRFPDGSTGQVLLTPEASTARNWGFDVTPARLVTAFITERGVLAPSELATLRD